MYFKNKIKKLIAHKALSILKQESFLSQIEQKDLEDIVKDKFEFFDICRLYEEDYNEERKAIEMDAIERYKHPY